MGDQPSGDGSGEPDQSCVSGNRTDEIEVVLGFSLRLVSSSLNPLEHDLKAHRW